MRLTQTLTCTCGKKSLEVSNTGITMGDIMKQTNFTPISSFSGETIWLCSDCYGKVNKLALEILRIVGDEELYFLNLLQERCGAG